MAESSPNLSFLITLQHEHRLIFTRDVFAPENLTLAQTLTPREAGENVRALVIWDAGLETAFPGFAEKITRWFAARGDTLKLAAAPVSLPGDLSSRVPPPKPFTQRRGPSSLSTGKKPGLVWRCGVLSAPLPRSGDGAHRFVALPREAEAARLPCRGAREVDAQHHSGESGQEVGPSLQRAHEHAGRRSSRLVARLIAVVVQRQS
jgi:hypothetical protein